jgi:hypothetical protein
VSGPGKTRRLGRGATGLVSDATGNVFALNADDYVLRQALGTDWTTWTWDTIGSGATSLTSDASGNVFARDAATGTLSEHVLGDGWNWI